MKLSLAATAAAVICASSQAALIYSTDFDAYTTGNISGQTAWSGTGGTWATTGSVNTGQFAGSVQANPAAGGTGKSVRLTSEKWNLGGRTKVWLDLLNSGKWAAASTGANSATKVLRAEVDIYVATGQPVTSSYGMMIGDTSATYSCGMLINNSGQVWTASNGYAAANRTNRTTAALDTWNKFRIDWDTVSGNAKAYLNNTLIADYTPTNKAGLYAVQLFTTTDNGASGSTTNNGFGFADNFSVSSVPAPGAAALVGLAGLMARRRRA